jgi:hypothetical protein
MSATPMLSFQLMIVRQWVNRHQLVVFAAPVLMLAACANPSQERADIAEFAKTQLVGVSKAEILACAGTPLRTAIKGNAELLTYVGSSGIAGTSQKSPKEHYCEVTFLLRRGFVEEVKYSGPSGGFMTQGEECAFVVQKCVDYR